MDGYAGKWERALPRAPTKLKPPDETAPGGAGAARLTLGLGAVCAAVCLCGCLVLWCKSGGRRKPPGAMQLAQEEPFYLGELPMGERSPGWRADVMYGHAATRWGGLDD